MSNDPCDSEHYAGDMSVSDDSGDDVIGDEDYNTAYSFTGNSNDGYYSPISGYDFLNDNYTGDYTFARDPGGISLFDKTQMDYGRDYWTAFDDYSSTLSFGLSVLDSLEGWNRSTVIGALDSIVSSFSRIKAGEDWGRVINSEAAGVLTATGLVLRP